MQNSRLGLFQGPKEVLRGELRASYVQACQLVL